MATLKGKLAREVIRLQEQSSVPRSENGRSRDIFRRRNTQLLAGIGILALLSWGASLVTEFSLLDSFLSVPRVVSWVGANMEITADTFSLLPRIMGKLMETVSISIVATVFAAVFAFVFAILGSRATRPHPALTAVCRLVCSVFRNIPVVAWALIFLFSFGQSSFTGFLAIFVETFGFLARSFMETVDESSGASVEALDAAGASWSQTIFQAVLPSVLPQMASWMLYMVESNIRSATLVGILTGSGIGFLFDLYYKTMNYSAAALVVLAIIVVVIAIELISNHVRRIIL
jgi:phosphonate transport system permease protein